jgi:hypothetical protein
VEAREVVPREGWAQTPAPSYVGRTVTAIQVMIEGVPSTEPALTDLIENRIGQPLLMHEVRDSITHLFSLGRFQDVQVAAEPADGGVRVRFDLIPIHAVERVEFTGDLGLSEGLLRRTVGDRFGAKPPLGRVADVVRLLNTPGSVRHEITQRRSRSMIPTARSLRSRSQPGRARASAASTSSAKRSKPVQAF